MKMNLPAIAAVSILLASPAMAQRALETVPVTVVVRFADLNLATAEGQNSLDRRIAGAIVRACPRPDTRVVTERNYYLLCRTQAAASTQAQIAQLGLNSQLANASVNAPTARLAP